MGQNPSIQADGYDLMKQNEIKVDHLSLSPEEAEAVWAAVDEKKEGVLAAEQLKKLFDGMASKFVEKIEASNKDALAKKRTAPAGSKKAAEEEKKIAALKQAMKDEFTCKSTVTYFCRAARMAENKLRREQFIATATAGGILKAHEKFDWKSFNQYKAPEKSASDGKKEETKTASANLTATEKAQLALKQQRQNLLARDDSADKLAKEVRAAQVDRLQEMFKKAEKKDNKDHQLNTQDELRFLIQMWYLPSKEEVDALMKTLEGKNNITADEYVKALRSVHPADMKIDDELVKELVSDFEKVAPVESKTISLDTVREMVSTSYLAPPQIVDKFIAVLDPEGKGKVSMHKLVDSFPDLEKALPDVFGRFKAAEEAKIRATRAALEALDRPSEKEKKKDDTASKSAKRHPKLLKMLKD